MIIRNLNEKYRYDVQSICLIFFPRETFKENDTGDKILELKYSDGFVTAEFLYNGKHIYKTSYYSDYTVDSARAALKMAVYEALKEATGFKSGWGTLTSIKPALTLDSFENRFNDDALTMMKKTFNISDEKLCLCQQVLVGRKKAVELLDKDSVCLYISIPFCPSRCSYCSFVSAVTGKETGLIHRYVALLVKELKEVKQKIESDHKKIKAIYVGGGTPSVLEKEELVTLLSTIKDLFLLSDSIIEYTFEAGRPDTITEEKLELLERYGVTRISINPQTLNDDILKRVNRKHDTEQFFKAFNTARQHSFIINVDLICGLPGDDTDSFSDSVKGIVAIRPDNITIHTLYIKRASDLGGINNVGNIRSMAKDNEIDKMLLFSRKALNEAGYYPYYLYRQKNTIGNGENVGYSLKDKECIYNVWMMDDLCSVYGAGAGAVTKLIKGDIIQRSPNLKLPLEYIKENENRS